MKAVLFCRVSSKDQEDSGYSLPSQEKLLTEYAEARGFGIAKIFSLSESAGGGKQRKMFLQMLDYLKEHKIKVLVVEKTDRLTRNMKDAVAVNSWIEDDDEKQVHFVKENFVLSRNSKSNDKFIWGIKVTTAQYYLDNLSEEVKKGQKEKLRQGWLPSTPPYGYKTIGEKGHKIHVVDEQMGQLVIKMFELYATGDYSLQKLTTEMHAMGLRSSKGGKVHKSRIHSLLTDPFYIGKNVWNGVESPGKHEPLIDFETFSKVGKKLVSRTTPYYRKHMFLFKGLFTCSECGGMITWEEQKTFVYGHCNHYRSCSINRWIREEVLETRLVEELEGLKIENPRLMAWLSKALKEAGQSESDFYIASTGELEKDRQVITKRMDGLYVDKLDGRITQAYHDEKFKEFSEQLKAVDEEIAKHTSAKNIGHNRRVELFDFAQIGKEEYLKGDMTKRRSLMRLVFEKLELGQETMTFRLSPDFALLKDLVTKTNSSKLPEIYENQKEIFEHSSLLDVSKYYKALQPDCSVLLALLDSNQKPSR